MAHRGLCWLLWWSVWRSFYGLCCPLPSALRLYTTCLAAFPCACGPTLPPLHPGSTLCVPAVLACAWGTNPPPQGTVAVLQVQERRNAPGRPPASGLLLSRGGGEGVLDPKLGVPKMARPDFPSCKFRFFPLWSLWSGEGGWGFWGRGPPPLWFLIILKKPCPASLSAVDEGGVCTCVGVLGGLRCAMAAPLSLVCWYVAGKVGPSRVLFEKGKLSPQLVSTADDCSSLWNLRLRAWCGNGMPHHSATKSTISTIHTPSTACAHWFWMLCGSFSRGAFPWRTSPQHPPPHPRDPPTYGTGEELFFQERSDASDPMSHVSDSGIN